MPENKNETVRHPFLSNGAATFSRFDTSQVGAPSPRSAETIALEAYGRLRQRTPGQVCRPSPEAGRGIRTGCLCGLDGRRTVRILRKARAHPRSGRENERVFGSCCLATREAWCLLNQTEPCRGDFVPQETLLYIETFSL